ncbi:MAG: DMT family transporter [Sphingobacteriia bacterium]|nr:DMT family transporter [Sphingobacteriia bacterium]
MNTEHQKKNIYLGFLFALITVVIWSGNYVIARGIAQQVPPISLAFFRWGTATLVILPLGFKKMFAEIKIAASNKTYFFFSALTGVSLFNTFIYVAGHYSTAINLVLLATTASPIFITVLAAFFLKEAINSFRIAGMVLCVAGILILISKGSLHKLEEFRFSTGDLWILASALAFAVYNILVRKKPEGISPTGFLTIVFSLGSLMLLPFSIWEIHYSPPIHFTTNIIITFLYLGIGNSVIGFFCWNAAIARIGAGRTSLFGNLMPVLASVEAVIFLGEEFTTFHLISGMIVLSGLVIANLKH